MMSGLLYALLFLALGGSLCNPARIKKNSKEDDRLEQPVTIYYPSIAEFVAKLDNFHKRLTTSILAHNPGQNLVYSPISISTLLYMILMGSNGKTKEEITTQFGIDLDPASVLGFRDTVSIMSNVTGVELAFANVLFASENMDIGQHFRKLAQSIFKAELQKVNFENRDLTAQQINNWCKTQTKNQISEIIKPAELSGIRMMLANAIYFKGNWAIPFDVSKTKDNVPFVVNNDKTVFVSMMYISGEFKAGWINNMEIFYVELPYAHEENDKDTFSMYLFMPYNNHTLESLEKHLKHIDFKSLNSEKEHVDINVPKFKIQSKLDIKLILQNMGMTLMFTDEADFNRMVNSRGLSLNKVVQKASLTVNEQGSEAAAISDGGFTDRISTPEFTFNKPFICAIVLKRLGIPVFFARIVDPTTSA